MTRNRNKSWYLSLIESWVERAWYQIISWVWHPMSNIWPTLKQSNVWCYLWDNALYRLRRLFSSMSQRCCCDDLLVISSSINHQPVVESTENQLLETADRFDSTGRKCHWSSMIPNKPARDQWLFRSTWKCLLNSLMMNHHEPSFPITGHLPSISSSRARRCHVLSGTPAYADPEFVLLRSVNVQTGYKHVEELKCFFYYA